MALRISRLQIGGSTNPSTCDGGGAANPTPSLSVERRTGTTPTRTGSGPSKSRPAAEEPPGRGKAKGKESMEE